MKNQVIEKEKKWKSWLAKMGVGKNKNIWELDFMGVFLKNY